MTKFDGVCISNWMNGGGSSGASTRYPPPTGGSIDLFIALRTGFGRRAVVRAVVQRQPHAARGEPAGDRAADASRGTRHQGCLALAYGIHHRLSRLAIPAVNLSSIPPPHRWVAESSIEGRSTKILGAARPAGHRLGEA